MRTTTAVCVAVLVLVAGQAFAAGKTLMMATTTSTDDTGLLKVLAPFFEKETGIELKWTATGSGKALELGRNCDVDVLLVHAPEAEKKYVADGFGTGRTQIMYNDFVLVGPAKDAAKVKGKAVAEALKTIAAAKGLFVSRGDDSGTHKMELSLWKAAGLIVPDKEAWYVQAGQGMMATLNMAAERGGYALTDRGTYITYEAQHKGAPVLVILVEGDAALANQYSVIPVNPAKCKNVKSDLAAKYAEWMAAPSTQKRIGEFTLHGRQLFFPNAGK
jgi:tungstate transport system substrate-binding protein